MRSILLFTLLPVCLVAAPALGIVKPVIAQSDGGDPVPPGMTHGAGETMFFSCNIAGFTKTPDSKINLAYTVQAFDPKGVPLAEIYKGEAKDEISPEDKDWLPRIETPVVLPDILRPGAYKIVIKTQDLVAKTSAELTVPFDVVGRDVAASPTLTVTGFSWFHTEDDQAPLNPPVYHAGDPLWMKFDMTGFKYGANNKIDVSFQASLVLADGKVIWNQPQPAVEQSEAFYPKPYVSAEFGINLQKDFKPGTYTMAVMVRDAIGKQTYPGKFQFTVQ
jgi:hypothetical protein